MKILVTGSAGFIGHHIVMRLVNEGHEVTGLDNLNEYYDLGLKKSRLSVQGFITDTGYGKIAKARNCRFIMLDLCDKEGLLNLFKNSGFDYVINLAAQAGVRYSLINPQLYIDSNVTGFLNLLECCRDYPVKHLIFASSSSVYGTATKIPFEENDDTSHPISLYAASKKTNELMAHTYSHLFEIPLTGLRFFTVYGPWGRPDMALFIFTKAILEGTPFDVYNNGEMKRDFTYVDDIAESINRLLIKNPVRRQTPDKYGSTAPYQVFNIGNSHPVNLIEFISAIETAAGIKGKKVMKPIQPGDVLNTFADVENLEKFIEFAPGMDIQTGINNFVSWYKSYYFMNRTSAFSGAREKTEQDIIEGKY